MDKMSVVRTVLLIVSLINMLANILGWEPLPVNDEQVNSAIDLIYNIITVVLTIISAIWAWWKNNYLSKRGTAQKTLLDRNNLYTP